MRNTDDLVSIYSGTEASVLLLKGKLDMMGIACQVRKDSTSGTWGIVPENIELCIDKSQRKEAEPVVNQFMRDGKVGKL